MGISDTIAEFINELLRDESSTEVQSPRGFLPRGAI